MALAGGATNRGLERVALDLHLHTPASHDWRGPAVEPEAIVQQALSQGLDGIAVTDHNRGDWIDKVKAAAAGTGLVVIPGVELNGLGGNEGIHLVVLFDVDVTSEDVRGFLVKVGAVKGTGPSATYGSPTRGLTELLDDVDEFGAIAVLAHCQSEKGALGGMKGDVRNEVVQHRAVLAVEAHCEEFYDEEKQKSRRRTFDWLDGTDANYKRELAVYQASDNPASSGHGHGLETIGQRFTYFYMERPVTLEGLRQCFIDRTARIVLPRPNETVSAEIVGFPRVAQVQVSGGFLDGLDLAVHRGLTTLIGSKGSGKSVLIELLRFCLNQEPTQPEVRRDHETKLAKRLGNYGRVVVTVVHTDGSSQRIEREFDPANHHPYHGVPLNPGAFPCHFLSQGEIVRIAESELEQIKFIDSFFDFRAFQAEITRLREQLSGLDRQVADQIGARKKAETLQADQTKLQTAIAERDKQLESPIFSKHQEAQSKLHGVDRATASVRGYEKILADAREALSATATPAELADGLAEDPLSRRVRDLAMAARQTALEGLTGALDKVQEAALAIAAERARWLPAYEKLADEYSKEVHKLGGDKPAVSQDRARLVNELARLETELNDCHQRASLLTPTVRQREQILENLRAEMAKYTETRQERCRWFEEKSSGQINASVSVGSNREDFRDRLTAMKRGSYLTSGEIEAISEGVTPDAFVRCALRYHLSQKDEDLIDIATPTGLGLGRVKTLVEFLLNDHGCEALLNLQHSAEPQDRPAISFRVEDQTYRPLSELSTGQKCTALLVMTLCEGDNPIVVDQPEDSLDIRSIWDDMCLRLRQAKRSRQFIFTTHNSSLAVASDTDRFVVLAGGADTSQVVLAGAIDREDVRHEVITLLEGGAATYFLKQRKYNVKASV